MLSIFKEERDAQGRQVMEIGMNPIAYHTMGVIGPVVFLVFLYFAFGQGPGEVPWFMIAAPIVMGAIAYPAMVWIGKRTRVRVTVDSKAGKLLVATAGGQSEIPMADLAGAEFAATSSGDDGGKVYRLEFLMKNGERIPATTMHTNAYGLGDQAKMVTAIKAALGRQMV